MFLDRVLVPLDFGLAADRALPTAQAVAHKLRLPVDAVVVTSRGLSADADEDEAYWHARQAGCRLRTVELRTEDDPVDGILAAAESPATLLCLSTHARGAVADLAIRSVGEQVLRRSTHPVMAVGPGVVVDSPPTPTGIVCCVGDDPAPARRLCAVTAAWARALSCDPWLIHVTGSEPLVPEESATDGTLTGEVTRDLLEHGVAAPCHVVVADDPADGILQFARTRPELLLVMATHGRTGLQRLVLGSVTLDVLRRSPHPVLVVPSGLAGAG